MSTRAPAIAGTFYDANANRLQYQVNAMMDATSAVAEDLPQALIVPHAGYIYSGTTAAYAYRCLLAQADYIRRVLLIGPAHRVAVKSLAIPSVEFFSTPLGAVALDADGMAQLGAMPEVLVSDQAHRDEHCLEVQLPFLQTVLPEFTLLPLLVGGAGAKTVGAVIDHFSEDPHNLILISSDLSHFLSYDDAQRIDSNTCELILQKATSLTGQQACGARAINGLMASALGRRLRVTLLHSCNSGDTAGDRKRVVGYAAFALH